jgi:hypothetical protein
MFPWYSPGSFAPTFRDPENLGHLEGASRLSLCYLDSVEVRQKIISSDALRELHRDSR